MVHRRAPCTVLPPLGPPEGDRINQGLAGGSSGEQDGSGSCNDASVVPRPLSILSAIGPFGQKGEFAVDSAVHRLDLEQQLLIGRCYWEFAITGLRGLAASWVSQGQCSYPTAARGRVQQRFPLKGGLSASGRVRFCVMCNPAFAGSCNSSSDPTFQDSRQEGGDSPPVSGRRVQIWTSATSPSSSTIALQEIGKAPHRLRRAPASCTRPSRSSPPLSDRISPIAPCRRNHPPGHRPSPADRFLIQDALIFAI